MGACVRPKHLARLCDVNVILHNVVHNVNLELRVDTDNSAAMPTASFILHAIATGLSMIHKAP